MMSRPSRARGLKYHHYNYTTVIFWSRPSRARGLKSARIFKHTVLNAVAPFTGAWIEIVSCISTPVLVSRRALHGRVD